MCSFNRNLQINTKGQRFFLNTSKLPWVLPICWFFPVTCPVQWFPKSLYQWSSQMNTTKSWSFSTSWFWQRRHLQITFDIFTAIFFKTPNFCPEFSTDRSGLFISTSIWRIPAGMVNAQIISQNNPLSKNNSRFCFHYWLWLQTSEAVLLTFCSELLAFNCF